MVWAVLYGALAFLVGLITLASKDRTLQVLSGVLIAAWALSNIAYVLIGPPSIPLVDPTIEAVMALIVTMLPLTRSTAAVFGLYGLMLSAHLWAFATGNVVRHFYFVVINGIFAAQLLVVGGSGVWRALRDWRFLGGGRPDPVYPSRLAVAETRRRHRAF